jgi:hypothetical protein
LALKRTSRSKLVVADTIARRAASSAQIRCERRAAPAANKAAVVWFVMYSTPRGLLASCAILVQRARCDTLCYAPRAVLSISGADDHAQHL